MLTKDLTANKYKFFMFYEIKESLILNSKYLSHYFDFSLGDGGVVWSGTKLWEYISGHSVSLRFIHVALLTDLSFALVSSISLYGYISSSPDEHLGYFKYLAI